MGQADYGGGLEDWQVYPSKKRLDGNVPHAIREAFDEAVLCQRVHAFTAATIMCRRAIEIVCSEEGVKNGSLQDRLKKLLADKKIDNRLYDWADALRSIGNDAAHEPDYRASKEDATDAIEFAQAFIEQIFVIEKKFKEFLARRTATPTSLVPLQPVLADEETQATTA